MHDSVSSSRNQGLHSRRIETIQESRMRGFILFKPNFRIRKYQKDQKIIAIFFKDVFRHKYVRKEENCQTFQGQPRTLKSPEY